MMVALPVVRPVRVLAVAALGALLGAALVAVGNRLGVAVLVGLPVGAVLLVLALDNPVVGIALVALVLPVALKRLPSGFVVIQGAALMAILAVALRRLAAGRLPFVWSPLLGWGVAVFAIALLATPRSIDPTLAVKQDIDLAVGTLLVLAVISSCTSTAAVRRLVNTLLVVGTAICLASLSGASSLRASAGAAHVDHRLRGIFTDPNQFGGFCAIVFILAITTAIGARSRRERVGATLATLATAAPLALALSRGAWLGCLVALSVLVVLLPAARRLLVAIAIPVLVAAPLLLSFAPDQPAVQIVAERVSTLRHPAADPYDQRIAIWKEAEREIIASPWLGQGPGQFPVVAALAVSEAATVKPDHAHNVLLTVAAEIGIPAALLVIGFTLHLTAALRRTVRRLADSPDAAFVAGIGASLGVVIGQGLVDFTMRNQAIFLLVSLLTGFLIAADRLTTEPEVAYVADQPR
ncbi:MAG TPA: O-antigen ligase family protein [Mycobacteriales bacterium]|nr:O-antigen ligase family protein [Mycobacteriales bacterium]